MLKRYFLTLAAVCLPHFICTQSPNILVKNHFPNAYQWYLDMSEKYPDAKLSSIEFCICDHHHAKNHTIYFPKSSIEFINSWYKSPQQSSEIQELLAQEEYLLLHEACHVLNYDYEKAEFIKIAALGAGFLSSLNSLVQVCTQSTIKGALQQGAKGTAVAAVFAAGVLAYTRYQEKNADHFTNQNGDQPTLEAGINWHKENKKELNIPQDVSTLQQLIIEQISDLAHPRPTKRQERAENSYTQRFPAIT
jgi:hypothetical protein